MAERVYLRPEGFIRGDIAKKAVADGQAMWIAGGPVACLAFELIERRGEVAQKRLVPLADIANSSDARLKILLERIQAPRAPIAGINLNRPILMGILNVTPDSFSDGGDFAAEQTAITRALQMQAEGADIIDIGGESTRPGSMPVDEAEEYARTIPVIAGLKALQQPISIDTRKAGIARAALERGAAIINDVSAFTYDADMTALAVQTGAPAILMHAQGDPRTMQDNPDYRDVLLDVYDFLEGRLEAAIAHGISRDQLIVDPGIGFGKLIQHNLDLINRIGLLHALGVPILLGVSRKRFIGQISGAGEARQRIYGSIALAQAAAEQGVQLFRVHDVAQTKQAFDSWKAIQSSGRL